MRLPWLVVCCVACGGDRDTSAITEAEAAGPCAQECAYDATCGAADPTCQDTCVADIAGWERRDAAEDYGNCIAKVDCNTDPDETCLPKIAPLSIHRTWAAKCATQLADCATTDVFCAVDFDLTDFDLGFVRFIAPPIVDEMIACLDGADCTTRLACTNDVLTAHGIQ